MGDRANIVVLDDQYSTDDGSDRKATFFYTHGGGTELPKILKEALTRGTSRWTDTSYLARIIFCEMIKDDVLDTTGFGISPTMTDNTFGRPVLMVDTVGKTVSLLPEEAARNGRWIEAHSTRSFDSYCSLKNPSWKNLNKSKSVK